MNRTPRRLSTTLLALLLVFAPGCSHVTTLSTDPGDAVVSFDGQVCAKDGPEIEIPSRYGLPGEHRLEVVREGYKPVDTLLRRSYHADASLLWLLAGLVPYVFTARLDDRYDIELAPDVTEGIRPASSLGGPVRDVASR